VIVNQERADSVPGSAHTVWVEGLSVKAIKTVEESLTPRVGVSRVRANQSHTYKLCLRIYCLGCVLVILLFYLICIIFHFDKPFLW